MTTPTPNPLREKIEELVVSGHWKPGERLDEVALATQFNVSRTPIREVLNQLVASGILEYRPNKGVFVEELSSDKLLEMFEMMTELEVVIGRFAARRFQERDRVALLAAQEMCERTANDADERGYDVANEAFHSALYAAAHNSYLESTALNLKRRLRRYRSLQFSVPDRMKESAAEHRRILAAIFGHDPATVERELHSHTALLGHRILDYIIAARGMGNKPARVSRRPARAHEQHG